MIRINTIFGGKNPHPNFLVGGMATPINMDNEITINQVKLDQLAGMFDQALSYTEDVYLPDVITILGCLLRTTRTSGCPVRTSWRWARPATTAPVHRSTVNGFRPCGHPGRRLHEGHRLRHVEDRGVRHQRLVRVLRRATPSACRHGTARPARSTPVPSRRTSGWPTVSSTRGRRRPGTTVAPFRWGRCRESCIAYLQGDAETVEIVDPILAKLKLRPDQLNSTAGRILARAVEAVLLARQMKGWFEEFVAGIVAGDVNTFNAEKWDPDTWPAESKGVGFAEVARGTLSHWVHIQDGTISNYQCVVPSTWNGSGRALGQRGPVRGGAGERPSTGRSQPRRSRPCGRSTPSTRASPAAFTCSMPPAPRSPGRRCSETVSHVEHPQTVAADLEIGTPVPFGTLAGRRRRALRGDGRSGRLDRPARPQPRRRRDDARRRVVSRPAGRLRAGDAGAAVQHQRGDRRRRPARCGSRAAGRATSSSRSSIPIVASRRSAILANARKVASAYRAMAVAVQRGDGRFELVGYIPVRAWAVAERGRGRLFDYHVVWDMWVRFCHWSWVAAILVLTVTGYLIANPWWIPAGWAESEDTGYFMGFVRLVHYLAAVVLILVLAHPGLEPEHEQGALRPMALAGAVPQPQAAAEHVAHAARPTSSSGPAPRPPTSATTRCSSSPTRCCTSC